MKVSIIIPSYNGLEILKKSLTHVVRYSQKCEIIVVDDGSTDDTVGWLKTNFPGIRVIRNNKNLGFPKTVNAGVNMSSGEYIVLLNNDVYPKKGYISNSLKYFSDDKVFAVTFNEEHSSWPQVFWNGKIEFTQGEDKSKSRDCAWASGGSSIIRRSIWTRLDGFNPIYSPGYWEDIDLGWRAWKAGYKIVWAPEAKVTHKHESTFKKLDQNWLSLIKQRNELLFTWQNISDGDLLLSHIWFLIKHAVAHPGYIRVILSALSKISQTKLNRFAKLSDRQVLEQLKTQDD